jgi:transcriptional regulator with XRE-family HTH domain
LAVGARIRAIRLTTGLTQSALANGLGVSFQQVQKYERGRNRVSASMLVKTASILGTCVAALVGEGESQTDPQQLDQFAIPGATDLLRAFAQIDDATLRKALLVVAQAIAAKCADRPLASRDGVRRSDG